MVMDEDLKARLLKPRAGEETIEIEGVGTIRVRALTRAEVMRVKPNKNLAARERQMLLLAMVDPVLTEAEIAAWYRNSTSGEIEKVSLLIAKISGMEVGVDKRAYQQFEEDPDADFQLLSGKGTGRDDGGRDERSDE